MSDLVRKLLFVTVTSALLIALVTLAACTQAVKDGSGLAAPTGLPSPSSDATSVFDASPNERFDSFDEAERVAGYHIPRSNSTTFIRTYGQTNLQFYAKGGPPTSSTPYTTAALSPTSIFVKVAPSYIWGGDSTWTSGTQTTLGGKSGWSHRDGSAFFFAYKCGIVGGATLWCVVTGPTSIDEGLYGALVLSLS